jgi:hypothetical protein
MRRRTQRIWRRGASSWSGPCTGRAALRPGVPTYPGTRGLGRAARKNAEGAAAARVSGGLPPGGWGAAGGGAGGR